METNKYFYEMIWNDIHIEIIYTPSLYKSYEEVYGYPLSHLEIKSTLPCNAPLPITETGYKSEYFNVTETEDFTNPINYVRSWLDEASESPEWIEYQNNSNQLSLI